MLEELKGNMTYEELACKIGISAYSLHAWITKKKIPTLTNLNQISKYMDISLLSLMKIILSHQDSRLTTLLLKTQIENSLSLEDKLELLAWLSFSIKNQLSNQDTSTSLLGHMPTINPQD